MRRFQSIGILLSIITGLLVLLLVAVFANSARQAYERRQAASQLMSSVRVVHDVYAMAELLHVEDGRARMALAAPGPASAATRDKLQQLHDRGEQALDLALRDMAAASAAPAEIAKLRRARMDHGRLFGQAMDAIGHPSEMRGRSLGEALVSSINLIVSLGQKQSDDGMLALSTADPLSSETMKIVRITQIVRDVAGIGRRMVGQAIISGGRPSAALLHDLAELDGRFNGPWAVMEADSASLSLSAFPKQLQDAMTAAKIAYLGDTRRQRDEILSQLAGGQRPMTGESWMQVSDRGLNALARISTTAISLTEDHVAGQLKIADQEFSLALLLMLVSISLASLTAIFVNLRVIVPLRSIVGTMSAVASGDLKHAIPFTSRQDEIGEFARALCLFRDNTLEKQYLEGELRHVQVARESAEASSRVKSEFLANMSHELRTPLNAILGFSDLMKSEIFGPLLAQYREYAALIHESGDHLLNLVSDLLDIAKIEAGKFVVSIEPVELLEAMDYCARLLHRRAHEKGVTLTVDGPQLPLVFSADPRGFRQILINLLSNAIKFTRKGGQVGLSARVEAGLLRIVVSDTGIGMSEDLLARVGRPFEQASSNPSHAREGTGLGLSLVRAIIAQHGGTFEIQSRENVGTTVTICLPLAQENRAAA